METDTWNEQWWEDDNGISHDDSRRKERFIRVKPAPWAEVFGRIAQGIEWQIMDDADEAAREYGYGSYGDMERDRRESRL